MNYENMKKAELIKELENQKHLAKAVEAKDKEISTLKDRYADYVPKKALEDLQKDVEKLKDIAASYVTAHRDTLKLTRQSLDMAIFTEELLSQKLK